MISSLRGRLVAKNAELAVIECAGVGYGVHMPVRNLADLGVVGSEVVVLTHTQIGQDILRLYGFLDEGERRTFQILISVSRVGPKLALAVLSSLSADDLQAAVARNDLRTLSGIPGVGKKTAERLLLELRDKLPKTAVAPDATQTTAAVDDVLSALLNLGFKESIAEQAAQAAVAKLPDESDVANLVREALRLASRP